MKIASYSPYPVSFFITSFAFAGYVLVRGLPLLRRWLPGASAASTLAPVKEEVG